MKDRVKFHQVDAMVEVNCAVCDKAFYEFPDMDDNVFECPKCKRLFRLLYGVKAVDRQLVIKNNILTKDLTND